VGLLVQGPGSSILNPQSTILGPVTTTYCPLFYFAPFSSAVLRLRRQLTKAKQAVRSDPDPPAPGPGPGPTILILLILSRQSSSLSS